MTDAIANVPSEAPTALIAPVDYEHIFNAAKQQKKVTEHSPAIMNVNSEAPTVLIAPADYEHIFTANTSSPIKTAISKTTVSKAGYKKSTLPGSTATNPSAQPSSRAGVKCKSAPAYKAEAAFNRADSSAPTALVAPVDYEHIYRAQKATKEPKVVTSEASDALTKCNSEAPTALIAPADYEHIFQAGPLQPKTKKVDAKEVKIKQKIPSKGDNSLMGAKGKESKTKQSTTTKAGLSQAASSVAGELSVKSTQKGPAPIQQVQTGTKQATEADSGCCCCVIL